MNEKPGSSDAREAPTVAEAQALRRFSFAVMLALGCVLITGSVLALRLKSVLFLGVSELIGWSATVALIHHLFFRFLASDLLEAEAEREIARMRKGDRGEIFSSPDGANVKYFPLLPGFRDKGQYFLLGAGLVLVAACWRAGFAWSWSSSLLADNAIRIAAVLMVISALVLHFLERYAVALRQETPPRLLDGLRSLVRMSAIGCGLSAGVLFLILFAGRDLGRWVGLGLGILTTVGAGEAAVRAVGRIYQPRRVRELSPPVGNSLFLEAIGGGSRRSHGLVDGLERALGVRLREAWFLRYFERAALPFGLMALGLFWLSTAMTVVPVDSRGVRVRWGRYLTPPLEPGLHLTWPWPVESIVRVPAERIQEVVIGFERDLGRAVLWTVRHYEGEQNMLVGNGEDLLTVTMPFYYRIKDPIAWLQCTADDRTALRNIAQRQLIRVLSARETFRIMTSDREAIREAVWKGIQEETDRLGLGIKLVYAGLQDAHPPLDVAAAFQEVVSAEEEKETFINQGRAYRAKMLPAAETESHRLRTLAQAHRIQRTDVASGEAARFHLVETAQREAPDLFRFRLRMESLEQSLSAPTKIVVEQSAQLPAEFYLDLRKGPTFPPP